MRTLYTVLLRLALPWLLLRLWWRGRAEPGYREAVNERFGLCGGEATPHLVWLHAVSVGEARAAAPLISGLKREFPDHRFVLTCTTAAGRETLRQLHGESVRIAYLPYDYPESVQAFLAHFRPRLGVIMETELWPNLIAHCKAVGVPLLLANARMSEKSAAGYRRWRALTRPAFEALDRVCAQSEADAARLRALGARQVEVTGNLKFDATPDAAQLEAGRRWRERLARPVVLLASSREGEERLFLDAWPQAAAALFLIVPRHPRRFDEVAAFASSRRSVQPLPAAADRVHLGDTMGEMAFYYGAADVAVVGGSFAPLGGQNLIEALACGAPVIVGPHMFNFAEATRLALDAGAALQVGDAGEAVRQALALVEDEAKRREMGNAGTALCAAHRGATGRHMAACRALLGL